MVNQAYGEKFHPFAESGEFKDSMFNRFWHFTFLPVQSLAHDGGTLVVGQSERVIASNVFEETDFPTMSKGRVALLGDGESIDDWVALDSTPLNTIVAAHSMTSFFGQVSVP